MTRNAYSASSATWTPAFAGEASPAESVAP